MQSIGKLSVNSIDYYTDQLSHSVGEDVPVLRGGGPDGNIDYYTAHEAPARWMGSGLQGAGVNPATAVAKEAFATLMHHETLGGESMTRRFAGHGKVAAFDHTFSAPKSVSLLYAYGDDHIRRAVRQAHLTAVEEAMGYMERHASQSRIATKTRDREGHWKVRSRTVDSDGYVAAAFDHFTSRANDPQVHTHVVVINRVHSSDGWRAIDAKRAYAHAKAGGTIYQAVMRDHLTHQLGVEWKPVVNGMADIDGFSPELLQHFSTRRTEIARAVERYAAEHGGETHRRVWQTFTLETRQAKSHPTGEAGVTQEMKDYGVTSDIVHHWQQLAERAPEDVVQVVREVLAAGRRGIRPTAEQVAEAADRLTTWVTDHQAVFTERDLVAWTSALYPDGASVPELTDATRNLLTAARDAGDVLTVLPTSPGDLTLPDGIDLTADELDLVKTPGWIEWNGTVRFRALPGEPRYTTRLQLHREEEVLAAVETPAPVAVDGATLRSAAATRGLTDGQTLAMQSLSAESGRLIAVVGPGGSGKTYSIAAYADAATAAGHHLVGVATSAAAARKLGGDLTEHWTGTIAMLRHHLDTSHQPLPAGTVLVVDEASMVSTRDLAWLVQQADQSDGKLILLGDPKQLPSIDSGGLFHRIVAGERGVVTDLADHNQRQQLDVDRDALGRLRRGEIRAAVLDYQEAGRLHLGRDEYATKAAMVDAWWQDTRLHGLDRVRMLASRHDEVWMLNQLARVRMETEGRLAGPTLTNRWGLEFRAGDRVVVRDNWYRHSDLRNGQTGTITHIDLAQRSVTFRRDLDGSEITLPKRYIDRDLDHAYAQTIHTAQGQTFGITHLYADVGVRAEHGYTALSRARGETHLWLNDASGPLGECTHIHEPVTEDRIDALIRQLSQSVIETPAVDQGLPVHTATDQQLITWRDELAQTIAQSPLAQDVSDRLVALEAAIEEARQVAAQLGTSGAHNQVSLLEAQRDALADHETVRATWLEENAPILRRYSTVADELHHRIEARVRLYELDPPDGLVGTIGPRPADPVRFQEWRRVAATYAGARMVVDVEVDLSDPAVAAGVRWRDAADCWNREDSQIALELSPVHSRASGL